LAVDCGKLIKYLEARSACGGQDNRFNSVVSNYCYLLINADYTNKRLLIISSNGCITTIVIFIVFSYCKNKQINLEIVVRKYNNKRKVIK